MEQGKHTNDQDGVVCQGGNTTHTETPAAEAETDIHEHHDQTSDNGQEGIADQVVGDGCTHLLRLDDTQRVGFRAAELLFGNLVGEEVLRAVVQHLGNLIVDSLTILVHFELGGNLQLGAGTVGLHLGRLTKLLVQRSAHVDGAHRLVETDHIGAATSEVDTTAQATANHTNQADDDCTAGNNIEYFALADEVHMGITHKVLREGEREVHLLLMVQHPVDAETGDED